MLLMQCKSQARRYGFSFLYPLDTIRYYFYHYITLRVEITIFIAVCDLNICDDYTVVLTRKQGNSSRFVNTDIPGTDIQCKNGNGLNGCGRIERTAKRCRVAVSSWCNGKITVNRAHVRIGTQHNVGCRCIRQRYINLSLLSLDDEAGIGRCILGRCQRAIEGDVPLARSNLRTIDELRVGNADIASITTYGEDTSQAIDVDIANRVLDREL